jgi:hypothetical protein
MPKKDKLEGSLYAQKLARQDLTLPRQTIQRLKLVRAITGIPVKEWMRAQICAAVDRALCQRPGAWWLRPGARIYRMETDPGVAASFIPVPITVGFGGERVWIMEIMPDLHVGQADPGLGPNQRDGTILCDLSADEEGQVTMRRVLVSSSDVMPLEVAYSAGVGAVQMRKTRERRRATAAAHRAAEATRSGGD